MKKLVSRTSLLTSTITNEWRAIYRSAPMVLVILGGVIGYGILYNLLYRPNMVREAPVVVVDNSWSNTSRRLTHLIDSSPKVCIVAHCANLADAEQAIATNQAQGIIYLPTDLESRLERSDKSFFTLFASTTRFLYYEAIVSGVMGAVESLDSSLRPDIVQFIPRDKIAILSNTSTIQISSHSLFNPTKGYADYLIPAVLVAIIFQTMVMAISLRLGTARQNHSLIIHARRGVSLSSMAIVVVGRTFVYVVIYGVLCLFLLGLLPIIFDLPSTGNSLTTSILTIPYLIATALFGQVIGLMFRDGDSSLLLITFFSVGLLFLSGISYPLELMTPLWRAAHHILPASTAILGYIKCSSMGASPDQCSAELYSLWGQIALYFPLATIALRRALIRTIGLPMSVKQSH